MKKPNLQFQPGLSLSEFIATYGTDEQCETVLENSRCPNGYLCHINKFITQLSQSIKYCKIL